MPESLRKRKLVEEAREEIVKTFTEIRRLLERAVKPTR